MQPRSEIKKEINQRFGTAVRSLRHQLGISQEILAEKAGLDRTYIGHVERGARNVSLSTIDKLARALDVSTASLLAGPHPASSSAAQAGAAASAAVDILLVEDNRRDVEMTLRAFQKAEITNPVHTVFDGGEALEFLWSTGRYAGRKNEPPPRLVLLDLHLPKISGMEVLRRIKARASTRSIHVVVLSVSGSDETVVQALRAGAAAYIVKPVDFQNFSEVIPKLRFRWTLVQPKHDSLR